MSFQPIVPQCSSLPIPPPTFSIQLIPYEYVIDFSINSSYIDNTNVRINTNIDMGFRICGVNETVTSIINNDSDDILFENIYNETFIENIDTSLISLKSNININEQSFEIIPEFEIKDFIYFNQGCNSCINNWWPRTCAWREQTKKVCVKVKECTKILGKKVCVKVKECANVPYAEPTKCINEIYTKNAVFNALILNIPNYDLNCEISILPNIDLKARLRFASTSLLNITSVTNINSVIRNNLATSLFFYLYELKTSFKVLLNNWYFSFNVNPYFFNKNNTSDSVKFQIPNIEINIPTLNLLNFGIFVSKLDLITLKFTLWYYLGTLDISNFIREAIIAKKNLIQLIGNNNNINPNKDNLLLKFINDINVTIDYGILICPSPPLQEPTPNTEGETPEIPKPPPLFQFVFLIKLNGKPFNSIINPIPINFNELDYIQIPNIPNYPDIIRNELNKHIPQNKINNFINSVNTINLNILNNTKSNINNVINILKDINLNASVQVGIPLSV
jgi:hypothetical protein